MKNRTSFNILASYAYLGKSEPFCRELFPRAQSGQINVMIDSGAFTKFHARGNFSHINVDDYCAFLEKYADLSEKYVMLDVVGNEQQSKANYEEMVRRGFKPMFVATMFDKDFDYMKHTLDITPDICVAGGVTTKGPWMTKRFQDVYRNTDERARIHGLGYVTTPNIFRLPLASVDSSSWQSGGMWGINKVWIEKEGKLRHFTWKDFLKSGKKMPQEMRDTLDRLGVSVCEYLDEKNHHGDKSIGDYINTYAYIRFQRYCKQNGRDLFLAAANTKDVQQMAYIYENEKHLSYEQFKKIKK